LKPKSTINNTYSDLDIINKFESLEEYPNNKPVLLANCSGIVIYANSSLKKNYNLKEGSNLFEINSEPKLSKLFNNLSENDITSFWSDLLIKNVDDYYKSYLLNIEKVLINSEEIFIVYLDSHDIEKE